MKRVGYFLLVVSMLVWGLIFLLPFTGVSTSEMAAYGAVLYVVSYALFFAGGALVGKEALAGLKRIVLSKLRRTKSDATDEASPES